MATRRQVVPVARADYLPLTAMNMDGADARRRRHSRRSQAARRLVRARRSQPRITPRLSPAAARFAPPIVGDRTRVHCARLLHPGRHGPCRATAWLGPTRSTQIASCRRTGSGNPGRRRSGSMIGATNVAWSSMKPARHTRQPATQRKAASPVVSANCVRHFCEHSLVFVEVPGIEPGSFVALMGLLRAQCAVSLLGLTDHAHESV
jgi:hypothetical protein